MPDQIRPDRIITDEAVEEAEKLMAAERKIFNIIKSLPAEKRLPVLKAAAVLLGIPLP